MDEEEVEAAVRGLRDRSPFRYYGVKLREEVEQFEKEFANAPWRALCGCYKQRKRRAAHGTFGTRRRHRPGSHCASIHVGSHRSFGCESRRNSPGPHARRVGSLLRQFQKRNVKSPWLGIEERPVSVAAPEVGENDDTSDRCVCTPKGGECVTLELHHNQ
jgi:hypothetical protein